VIQPDQRGNVPSIHMNEHGITLRRGPHPGLSALRGGAAGQRHAGAVQPVVADAGREDR